MESRIEELMAKYWEGKTTLEEEAEIKLFYKENPSLTKSGDYFMNVRKRTSVKSQVKFDHPGKRFSSVRWSAAAAIVIGVMTAVLVLRDANDHSVYTVEDPKEAYEITRKALLMVSSGLNEGTDYSARELKRINEAEEIIMN